ncbi:MAG TPA: hypothetical protein VJ913_10295 [Actinomycetota bacterium]|nr:hypothetical protein [Actinomycetota bacterium]
MRLRSARALALAMISIGMVGACESSPDVLGTAEAPAGPDLSTATSPLASSAEPGSKGPDGPEADREASEAAAVYGGLGTWIDIYDDEAWKHPGATVRSMVAHGVRTVYLQTSNYSRRQPFVHPGGVAEFLDAASRTDLRVVAWYLPGFRHVGVDLRRTLHAIKFRTASGSRFDSFALDIESPEVARPWVRTRRLLALSDRIRRAVGSDYPLGAIVASPHRLKVADPRFWPGFPWRRLAATYDVFLPMTYYTYRVKGPRLSGWYTAKNVQIIREETSGMRVPIHVVGGISFDATGGETRGFVQTVREREVLGASYYTFPGITREQWDALRALEER